MNDRLNNSGESGENVILNPEFPDHEDSNEPIPVNDLTNNVINIVLNRNLELESAKKAHPSNRNPSKESDVIFAENIFTSPEIRFHQRAKTMGAIPLFLEKPIGGRTRQEVSELNIPQSPIADNRVDALRQALVDKQPVLDKFTKAYSINTTKNSIDAYVMAGNKNRKVKKSDDPIEQKMIYRYMRLQTLHIADKLQQEVFGNLRVAMIRTASVKAVLSSINNDFPLDKQAVKMTADTVLDFGYSLLGNKDILMSIADVDIAEAIIKTGEQMLTNNELLQQNVALLTLVRAEGEIRTKHWHKIFKATLKHLGSRLIEQDKLDWADLIGEIDRLEKLRLAKH